MLVTCPACGAQSDLSGLVSDRVARHVMTLLAALPGEVGQSVVAYLGLFRAPGSGLTWRHTQKILEEIGPMIQEGTVVHRDRTLPAPAAVWLRAIGKVLDRRDRLSLPMRDNAYLLAAVVDEADKHAAAQEHAKHEALRAGKRRTTTEDVTNTDRDGTIDELSQITADRQLGLIPVELAHELASAVQGRKITPEESRQRRIDARQETTP